MKTLWSNYYIPPTPSLWSGRADTSPGERVFNFIQCIDLQNEHINTLSSDLKQFGIIGFCSDEGIRRNLGRLGAKQGPAALRKTLGNLATIDYHDLIELYDFGDITCNNQNLEESQHALGEVISLLIKNNIIPIVLGGGHETSWGHYLGIADTNYHKGLGIINFDAHFDLRTPPQPSFGTSGTPFWQIAEIRHKQQLPFDYFCIGIQRSGNTKSLFDAAKQLGAEYILAEQLHSSTSADSETRLKTFLDKHSAIYLTICLDVFATAFAPGVSAPQALGIYPVQALRLLKLIMESKKVVSMDIVELSPPYDINEMTAKLAAGIINNTLGYLKS